MQTLQQQRAKHALEQIRKAEQKYQGENRKAFVASAENAPASILINGFGQAAATLLAQAKGNQEEPPGAVYDAIQDWLCGKNNAPFILTIRICSPLLLKEIATATCTPKPKRWLTWNGINNSRLPFLSNPINYQQQRRGENMVLPLYQLKNEYARERENLIGQAKGNTGLIFNKYFLGWEDNWDIKAGAKSGWIKQIGKNPAGNRILLEEAVERLLNLTDSLAGKFRCYKTIWRFATGLGLNNPVENGMAWHHTLGVPYLPGSSVKGLVRGWAEQWLDYPSQDEINRIFGPREVENEHEAAESVGSVIFFDALPAAPVRLAADVMTPIIKIIMVEMSLPATGWIPTRSHF